MRAPPHTPTKAKHTNRRRLTTPAQIPPVPHHGVLGWGCSPRPMDHPQARGIAPVLRPTTRGAPPPGRTCPSTAARLRHPACLCPTGPGTRRHPSTRPRLWANARLRTTILTCPGTCPGTSECMVWALLTCEAAAAVAEVGSPPAHRLRAQMCSMDPYGQRCRRGPNPPGSPEAPQRTRATSVRGHRRPTRTTDNPAAPLWTWRTDMAMPDAQ